MTTNDQPVTLWRVQTETNRGPFACAYAYDEMDSALLDAGLGSHINSMPTPLQDGLTEMPGMHCATTSPRQLVRWFPRCTRLALAKLDYHVVRYEVAPGGAQIGPNQAVYDPARARRIGSRALQPFRRAA